MGTPEWAWNLAEKALAYLQKQGYGRKAKLPDIRWRQNPSMFSNGLCDLDHIRINQGGNRIDCKLVLLHEMAHWVLSIPRGHEGHTPRFWDLAWELFREFKLPIRYCKWREGEFRKGAIVAYHRQRKKPQG